MELDSIPIWLANRFAWALDWLHVHPPSAISIAFGPSAAAQLPSFASLWRISRSTGYVNGVSDMMHCIVMDDCDGFYLASVRMDMGKGIDEVFMLEI